MSEIIRNPSRYQMPKPSIFLLLDDLSPDKPELKDGVCTLADLIDSGFNALVVDVPQLANRLQSRYDWNVRTNRVFPVDLTVTVGSAGEEVSKHLDLSVAQIRLNPTRRAGVDGMPYIVSKTGVPLEEEAKKALEALSNFDMRNVQSIGLIDDTIFFGGTINAVKEVMAKFFPNSCFSALTLVYVKPYSRNALDRDVKVLSGLTLTGSPSQESGLDSIIASDLVLQDALPLSDGSSIPFMREENWMRAWFGDNYGQAIRICEKIKESL